MTSVYTCQLVQTWSSPGLFGQHFKYESAIPISHNVFSVVPKEGWWKLLKCHPLDFARAASIAIAIPIVRAKPNCNWGLMRVASVWAPNKRQELYCSICPESFRAVSTNEAQCSMMTHFGLLMISWVGEKLKQMRSWSIKSPEALQAPTRKVRRVLLSQQDIRHVANRAVTLHFLQQPAQKLASCPLAPHPLPPEIGDQFTSIT